MSLTFERFLKLIKIIFNMGVANFKKIFENLKCENRIGTFFFFFTFLRPVWYCHPNLILLTLLLHRRRERKETDFEKVHQLIARVKILKDKWPSTSTISKELVLRSRGTIAWLFEKFLTMFLSGHRISSDEI